MARPLRLSFENAVYHVTARGNRRENIFYSDIDKSMFLEKMIDVQPYYEIGNYLTYQKYWVPNKGVSCPAADPCQNRCEWEFENCIKKGDGLSCIAYRQSCYAKCGP